MMKRWPLGMFLCWFGGVLCLHAQNNKYIQGRLLGPKGYPMAFIGLEFKAQGFNHTLITDFFGAFKLEVPKSKPVSAFLNDPKSRGFVAKFKADTLKGGLVLQLNTRQEQALEWPEVPLENKPELFAVKEAMRRRVWNLSAPGNHKIKAETIMRMSVPSSKATFPRLWLWEVVPDTSETGTQYLSQSISTLYFGHHPRGFLEQVEGYRYRGLEQTFSREARAWHAFSLYDSRTNLPGFTEVAYQSPIGWGAPINYKYHFLGNFYRNGRRMIRIGIEPKNPYQALWAGEMVLEEGSWQIVSASLKAAKTTGLYRIDSLHYRLETSLTDMGWMPSSLQVKAWKQTYGASLVYDIQASYQKPKNIDSLPPGMGRKGYRLSPQVLNFDESYWAHFTCLSPEESAGLCAEDSLLQLPYTSRVLYDSLSKVRKNPFRWYSPIIGHTFINRKDRTSLYFDGLLNDKMEYNTVEGMVLKQSLKFTKSWANHWNLELEPILRYGFSDNRFKGQMKTRLWSSHSLQEFQMEGGSYMFQINQSNPINSFVNSFYSLFLRQNFMKLYRKEYFRFHYERELLQGIYLSLGMEWARRSTLENTANFSFFQVGNGFTSNNPNAKITPNYRLFGHQGTWLRLGLTIKPGQQFRRHLGHKEALPSDLPKFSLFLNAGIPNLLGSQINYALLEISASDKVSFGAAGETAFVLRTGIFLQNKSLTYLDFVHFLGEQTYFLGSASQATYLDQFRALDYYRYSSQNNFVEGHYQHDFRGFLLNRIPGINRLKWNYYAGLNFLVMFNQNITPYSEVFLGFDNLLGVVPGLEWFNFRFDVAMQLNENGLQSPAFLLGLNTRFNELLR